MVSSSFLFTTELIELGLTCVTPPPLRLLHLQNLRFGVISVGAGLFGASSRIFYQGRLPMFDGGAPISISAALGIATITISGGGVGGCGGCLTSAANFYFLERERLLKRL